MEAGLSYVNQENERLTKIDSTDRISRVILIGDAPANYKHRVKSFRAKKGEDEYWSHTRFSDPEIYYETECAILHETGIPIHAFWVRKASEAQNEMTREGFQHMADLTNGTCEELDIDSDAGADHLTHLVSTAILAQWGPEYVKAYKDKFGYL